jgi:glycerophosphoryl diester phosphodiesterase
MLLRADGAGYAVLVVGWIGCLWMSQLMGVEIYGHRGMAGLLPENTVVGYEAALELGVDAIDVDVGVTRDKIVVASHDPFLNPALTRDQYGRWIQNPQDYQISKLLFADLKAFDVGRLNPHDSYRLAYPDQQGLDHIEIPSLQSILALLKKPHNARVKVQIEMKTSPVDRAHTQPLEVFVKSIIDCLNEQGMLHRAELQSFDWEALLLAKRMAPEIKTSFITEQVPGGFDTFAPLDQMDQKQLNWAGGHQLSESGGSIPKLIRQLKGQTWCPFYKNLNAALVREAHDQGLRVVPWTVDHRTDIVQMIEMGVDGVITNRPDILKQMLMVRQ